MDRCGLSIVLAALALVGAGLTGCGDRSAPATASDETGAEDPAPPPPPPAPAAETWPARRPHATLLVVGAQDGVLRPSATRELRVGGLERLAALAEALQHRVVTPESFAGISLGGTLARPPEPQGLSKAAYYRAVLEALSFRALLLGTADLLEPAMVHPREGGGEVDTPRPPVNVPLGRDGMLAIAAWTEPFATFSIRGQEIRALHVVDPDLGDPLVQSGVAEVVVPPAGALQTLSPRPDTLWIVGVQGSRATLLQVREAMARLGPTILVDLGGDAGRDRVEDLPLGDQPLVLRLGDRGRQAGVLDLDPRPEAEGGGWRVSWHLVDLVPAFDGKDSRLRRLVHRLFERYQTDVRERGYLASFPSFPDRDGLSYVGSSRCASCHPGIYESWSTSRHALALETLARAGDAWDPSCVRCHVVGFERFPDGTWRRFRSGFQTPSRTPFLGGVGCEACHGPGSAHVARPEDASVWAGPVNRRRPDRRTCLDCHDPENAPGFLEGFEEERLPSVDHRGVPSDRRTVR